MQKKLKFYLQNKKKKKNSTPIKKIIYLYIFIINLQTKFIKAFIIL